MKDIVKTKSLFLPSELPGDEGSADIYSLEIEFARTRRNRNIAVWLAVSGFVFFLVAATVAITLFIEKKNMESGLVISEYQDLNLRDLLDNSRKFQNELDRSKKTLAELRIKKQAEVNAAATAGSRRAISRKYDRLIRAEESNIADIQKKIDQYDLTMRDNIRKAEAMVNNYRRLHAIELQREKDRLIMMYNPWFTSARMKRIMAESVDRPSEKKLLNPFAPVVKDERIMTKAEFERLHRRVENQLALVGRMNEIPYRNSPRSALRQMDSLYRSTVHDYEQLWSGLAGRLAERSDILNGYAYAFDYLTKTRPESGYIIDARDSGSILVYINRIYSIADGTEGYVFRSDDAFIGTITFFRKGGAVRARVTELAKGKAIAPFDRILLKKGPVVKNGSE